MATKRINGYQPHICIVGAGVAGLRCADVLIKANIKVTMYEGRDRIGGRVHQQDVYGHSLDLGANWIHGTNHNPILDLAKETNSVACSVGDVSSTFDEEGHLMEPTKAEELSELMWGIIADAFKYSSSSSNSISPNLSLRDFFVEKTKVKGLDQKDRRTLLQMSEIWGGFIADHVEHQSLKYFWLEQTIDGENLFLSSTYKAILSRIAQSAVRDAEIVLSRTVTSIDTSQFRAASHKITVASTTSSGQFQEQEFDAAVLTVPLGSLKRTTPMLKPSLHPRLLQAVKNSSYGVLEKAFVSFDTAFWATSDKVERSTDTQDPVFRHFLHPQYAPLNTHSYDIGMMSLASLPGDIHHPTLLFYVHGNHAIEMIHLLAAHKPGTPSYDATLKDFLSPYYSRLPNYEASAPECKPRAFYATSWQSDSFAGFGSYTDFQIPSPPVDEGSEDYPHLDKDIEVMRHGEPERGLWLAGEHTAPFTALGTVTGAYLSGEAVGKRIIAWLHGEKGVEDASQHQESDSSSSNPTVQVGKGGNDQVAGIEI